MTGHSSFEDIKRRAEAKADADCELGLANLQAQVDMTPEWSHTTHLGAVRPTAVPARALLVGMLEHLERAMKQRR